MSRPVGIHPGKGRSESSFGRSSWPSLLKTWTPAVWRSWLAVDRGRAGIGHLLVDRLGDHEEVAVRVQGEGLDIARAVGIAGADNPQGRLDRRIGLLFRQDGEADLRAGAGVVADIAEIEAGLGAAGA